MSELDEQVDALRKAGRFAEAANLCLQAGDAERASELYAAVWDWPRAIEVAERAGFLALAYKHALAGDQRADIGRLLRALPDVPEQALAAAASAELKGRHIDAARLREAAGDILEAASLFERSGELFDAARCYESAGRYREAGMLYERRVREDPTDGEAALRLGRILAHFGRYDHAARALQTAEQDSEQREGALGLLVACFDALGMDEAAASCLDRLRETDSSLPLRVRDFLHAIFGDERGLAGLARGDQATQLLAGRYRVVRALGAGATGRVLLAHDGFYDREVAVKVLSIGTGAQGRDAYARFAREARVAAGLDHPNVVQVYEFNPDGPFLVMEHMAGGTLEDRMETGPLPLSVIRHVTISVLRGLEAVHRRGVIHRDLKPANIFFGTTGDVKLGDFGVAHLQDLGATLTGAMLGTLAYMAPEQITGSARPEAATDLYALGVILFRLLSGTLPFPGPDFVVQHLEQPVPRLSEVRPALRTRFDALLEWLLAKEMAERPQGVEELRQSIDALDWTDPAEDHLEQLIQQAQPRAAERVSRPAPAPPGERYTLIEAREGGAFLAQDTALDRLVNIEPIDPARAAFLRRLAKADGPHLQAIYEVDLELSRAIFEAPAGESLAQSPIDAERRDLIRTQLEDALARLHREGLVHGNVGPRRVRVGPGRAVLLLPREESAEGTPEADHAALEALLRAKACDPA